MQKNVAGQKWIVFAFNETNNTPVTGDAANITGNLRLDGGAANAIDDINPTELEDGYYIFDITQAESNADLILISPESSTANVQVIGVPGAVWTRPPNFQVLGIESDGDLTKVNSLDGHTAQTGDSFSRIGAPVGASISADIADVPTVSELNARTLVAADYFSASADTVTVGTNNDKTGYALSVTPPTAAEIQAEMEENGASILDTLQDRLTAARAGYLDNLSAGAVALAATALSNVTWTDARAQVLSDWINDGRLDVILDAVNANVNTILSRVVGTILAGDHTAQGGDAHAIVSNGTYGNSALQVLIEALNNISTLLEAEIATVTDQTHFTLVTGSDVDDAYNDQAIVLYDDSNFDYPSVRVITDYVGATKTVTIDAGADFTLGADDSVKIFVMRGTNGANTVVPDAAGVAPTAIEIRQEIDNNSTRLDVNVSTRSSHTAADIWAVGTRTLTSFGTLVADIWANVTRTLTAGTKDSEIDAINAKTANLPNDPASETNVNANETKIDLLPTLTQMNTAHALLATPAQVNEQVVDALNVDTYAEPGQGAPAATASIVAKIGYIYKSWRNKKDNDGTDMKLYADDGATVDQKSTVSESGGTVTIGEMGSGA